MTVSSVLDTGTCTQIDTEPVHFAKFYIYSLALQMMSFADKAEEEELVEAQTKPQPKQSEPKPQGQNRSFTTKPVIPKPARK